MRISDWSSDVCSSDLMQVAAIGGAALELAGAHIPFLPVPRNAPCVTLQRQHQRFATHAADVDAEGVECFPQAFQVRPVHYREQIEIGSASCRERVCQ